MQPRHFAAALGTVVLLAGCASELKLHRVGQFNADGTRKPDSGILYPTMFTTFEIDVTHRMVNCVNDKATIATTVVLKPAMAMPDLANTFMLEPASLSGPFKTGELTVKYRPTGAVASLNAVTQDKSIETIANVVGAAVKMATIGVANAGAANEVPTQKCPRELVNALEKVKELEPQFKLDTDALEEATAGLKKVSERLATLGANADERSKRQLADSLTVVGNAEERLKVSKASMDKLLDLLAISRTLRWPAHSGQFEETIKVDVDELEKWGGLEGLGVTRDLTLGFRLAHAYTREVPKNVAPTASISDRDGLPYRLPQPGLLIICKGKCTGKSEVYARQRANVLQLGPVFYMPCRSPAFSSNSCALSFAETSELETMGASQSTATAERISAALNDATTQYAAYRSTRASVVEKNKAAELAAAKQEVELRSAKLALDANPDVAATTSAYNAVAEKARAELAMIEAERALRAAQDQGATP